MNFVAEQNVARFRKLLETEEDAAKRAILEQLLHDELAKATSGSGQTSRDDPGVPAACS